MARTGLILARYTLMRGEAGLSIGEQVKLLETLNGAPPVRRQNIWDRWGPDLKEDWPHLGLIFRRRFFGVASADVRWSAV